MKKMKLNANRTKRCMVITGAILLGTAMAGCGSKGDNKAAHEAYEAIKAELMGLSESDYYEEYYDPEIVDEIIGDYPWMSRNLAEYFARFKWKSDTLLYEYCDIDKNGTDELLVSEYRTILTDIYAFDGEKVVPLFKSVEMDSRDEPSISILKDGSMTLYHFDPSPSKDLHNKAFSFEIAKDGYSLIKTSEKKVVFDEEDAPVEDYILYDDLMNWENRVTLDWKWMDTGGSISEDVRFKN